MSGFPINSERGNSVTVANIKFSVQNLFRTRVGERLLAPTFGTNATVFENQQVLNTVVASVVQQESRIAQQSIEGEDWNAAVNFDVEPLY